MLRAPFAVLRRGWKLYSAIAEGHRVQESPPPQYIGHESLYPAGSFVISKRQRRSSPRRFKRVQLCRSTTDLPLVSSSPALLAAPRRSLSPIVGRRVPPVRTARCRARCARRRHLERFRRHAVLQHDRERRGHSGAGKALRACTRTLRAASLGQDSCVALRRRRRSAL